MYKGNIGTGLLWLLCVVAGYGFFVIPGLILHLICIFSAAKGDPLWMTDEQRGPVLTLFAFLYVLLAISDFAKPFSHDPAIGFVYLGVRQSGSTNAILASLFGIGLLIFAYGIWTMRNYAMPAAYIFTAWVIINTILFRIKNPSAPQPIAFMIAATAIGIGVPLATAIILSRRRAELT
jgi:hypothetical protein